MSMHVWIDVYRYIYIYGYICMGLQTPPLPAASLVDIEIHVVVCCSVSQRVAVCTHIDR